MKLLDELIEILSNESGSLSQALIKGKVLAHKLGDEGLNAWLDAELNGYPPDSNLPGYRVINIVLRGRVSNGVYTQNRVQMPTAHLDERFQKMFREKSVTWGVAGIEEMIAKGNFAVGFPPEFHPLFLPVLSETYEVEELWGEMAGGSMVNLLTQIRSRFLEFVLNLSDKFPADVEASELKREAKRIDAAGMFSAAVFGPNAVINVVSGHHNTAVLGDGNTVQIGDLASLRHFLEAKSVAPDDVTQLEVAVKEDGRASSAPRTEVGPKVRNWMAGMLAKAGTAGWDISVQTAAAVLGTAISNYYGLS